MLFKEGDAWLLGGKRDSVSLLSDFASNSPANNCISIRDLLKASQQNQFNYAVHKV